MDSVSEFLVSDRLNVELVSIDLLDFRGVNGRDIGVRHALLNMMGFLYFDWIFCKIDPFSSQICLSEHLSGHMLHFTKEKERSLN